MCKVSYLWVGYALKGVRVQSSELREDVHIKGAKTYRDLKVYQKAYALSLEIYKKSSSFPKEEKFGITDQLRRSATSICANIAEGYGRGLTSNPDYKRFVVIARGSCQETSVWIDYSKDLGFIDSDTHTVWQKEYVEISKMLFSLIKAL